MLLVVLQRVDAEKFGQVLGVSDVHEAHHQADQRAEDAVDEGEPEVDAEGGVQGAVLKRDDEWHRVAHGAPDDAGDDLKQARHQREERAVPQHHELKDVGQQVAGKRRPEDDVRVPAGAHVVPPEPYALTVEREVLGHPENGQRRAAVLGAPEVALDLSGERPETGPALSPAPPEALVVVDDFSFQLCWYVLRRNVERDVDAAQTKLHADLGVLQLSTRVGLVRRLCGQRRHLPLHAEVAQHQEQSDQHATGHTDENRPAPLASEAGHDDEKAGEQDEEGEDPAGLHGVGGDRRLVGGKQRGESLDTAEVVQTHGVDRDGSPVTTHQSPITSHAVCHQYVHRCWAGRLTTSAESRWCRSWARSRRARLGSQLGVATGGQDDRLEPARGAAPDTPPAGYRRHRTLSILSPTARWSKTQETRPGAPWFLADTERKTQ